MNGLAAKLLALQFAAGDSDGFVVAALGRILKSEIGTIDNCAEIGEPVPKLPVEARASRKALQVIKDNNVVLAAIGLEVLKHADHTGALHVVAVAGLAVGVDGLNRDAELCGVISAEMLLATIAVSVEFLLLARHAAIDDGGVYGFHLSSSQDI